MSAAVVGSNELEALLGALPQEGAVDASLAAELQRLGLSACVPSLHSLGVRSAEDLGHLTDGDLEDRARLTLVQIRKLRLALGGAAALPCAVPTVSMPNGSLPKLSLTYPPAVHGGNGASIDSVDEEEEEEGDADFWKSLIQVRSLAGEAPRGLDELTVQDICDVTCDRLSQVFRRFDIDGDGRISTAELAAALASLGFEVGDEGAQKIMGHVMRKRFGSGTAEHGDWISARSFEMMTKWLRLAELFTPSAGLFQWSTSCGLVADRLTVCDYYVDDCHVQAHDGEVFFFRCQRPFAACGTGNGAPVPRRGRGVRWVHLDATRGLNRLTLLRLAVKYHLHPLAVGDVMDNRTMTKIDRYGRNYVVSADILTLAERPAAASGEPPRVRIARSHVTIFLAGPPHSDTMLTIHQNRSDESSWLRMWLEGRDEESTGFIQDSKGLWSRLLEDLKQNPPRRMREEAADFLLYEVLHRVVLQLRPIAEAYAERLGFMHQQTVQNLTQEWMDEVAEIKLEVYDFVRSIRPMKQVVKHFMDDGVIGNTAQMYLEDVDDAIDSVVQDVEHLTKMAESLEAGHERYRDKRMNDTLFTISMISAIFLPLQFFTGWYGMNFQGPNGNAMPELNWEYGYQYFFCLEGVSLLVSIAVILLVSGNCGFLRCCCCCCASRRHRRLRPRGAKVHPD